MTDGQSGLVLGLLLLLFPWTHEAVTVNSRCGVSLTVPDTNLTVPDTNLTVPDTNVGPVLKRVNITDARKLGAVCNDRSQGIYYIRETTSTRKWIIYLEGGVGCGNMEECNKRYEERPELMMSRLYPATIKGRDIFDPDPRVNPDYWDYNMVLIPYCTSDLWVGNSTWDPALGNEEFRFNSSATKNQFVFRGSTVFRTVVEELEIKGLDMADDVVLVGSSAGGIGAMNQAGWLRSQLSGNTTFSVILDSAWFINFHGNLEGKFDFRYVQQSMNFLSHIPCRDSSSVGYPCCISAPCMLSKTPKNNLDFPDIPVFVIFSQYDLFILAKALQKLENETDDVKGLEWFRTITMYGEVMRVRLNDTIAKKNMSYFVPSCLQHVYLATSDLREVGGFLRTDENLSNHDIEFSSNTKYFRSAIEPGMWSKTYITNRNSSSKVTLQCAINEWNHYVRSRSSLGVYSVHYSDDCFGARCNPKCPETIRLGILGELWPTPFKWVVVVMVIAVTVFCVLCKRILMYKKTMLLNGYRKFINRNTVEIANDKISLCLAEEAIGVACLNLRYSVRLSSDAISRAREVEKGRLAAEEESRWMLGYFTLDRTKMEHMKLEHPTKRGAITDLINTSACTLTRIAGAQTAADEVTGKERDSEMDVLSPNKNGTPDNSSKVFTFQDDSDGYDIQRVNSVGSEGSNNNDSLGEKTILSGISSYFNPGQMVAIMGPSGCGKTTFLDLMTGRRRTGKQRGGVYINGIPFQRQQEWYVKHSGYVLQLAVPYYEELTVRQNLLLAAFMRLPRSFSAEERFQRVECVIEQIGLTIVKDTVVGGSTGPGLSGGQKRRLAVAIQLLSLPRILFLDEPTSGLDATSSMEVLQHLQCIAGSGRLVVLTIHQPRLEIFHMFDRILLLCQGEVAYYGSPIEAPALFLKAYQVAKLGGDAPVLDHQKNPADLIMDMLGSELYRRAILNYYKMTFELKAVKNAIRLSKRRQSLQSLHADNEQADSGWINRLLVLETRAGLRTSLTQTLYLPAIFLIFSLVAGLAYLQADSMLLIMAAFSIYSFASSIFMFPPVYNHLSKALEIYHLERDDGIGRSVELLLQTFIRYVAISAIPLLICSVILCILILPSSSWSVERFFNVVVFTLALNQTWTSIAIMLVCVFPIYGHKLSPLVSCGAGFAGGFFIPPSRMKAYFEWLLYINPSYYGYSGMLRVVLPSIKTGCDYQSSIECYPDTGEYWLEDFGMEDVQPYLSLLILLIMTVAAFLVAWAAIEIGYSGLTFGDITRFVFGRRERMGQAAYSRVGEEEEEKEEEEEEEESDTDETSFQNSSEAADPENVVPSIAIDEPLAGAGLIFSNQDSDKNVAPFTGPSVKRGQPSKKRFARTSTQTSLLTDKTHSVFSPRNSSVGVEDNSSESRTTTLDGVRIHVARETLRRRDKMKSSMKAFVQMQMHLGEDDENLEVMDHVVPLRKIERRITRRRPMPAVIEKESRPQCATANGDQTTARDKVVLEHEV